MASKEKPSPEAAFNRLELVVVVAALGVLAGLAWPALANTKTRSDRLLCVSNLRQIGHALQVWSNDHGNRTPCRTSVSEGGLFGTFYPLRNNAWYHFAWMSNELGTPKILICPADKNLGASRVTAVNWSSTDPLGGYATIGFRDRATSYTVALDAFFDQPRSILSSDRNVRNSGINASCSSGVGDANLFLLNPLPGNIGWTNVIHFEAGNVLFYDGSVGQLSNPEFRAALSVPYLDTDNGVLHFLIPP